MSLRASPVGDAAVAAAGGATPSHCGSLYGPAVGHPVGGLWARLAVSPPRSPPLEAAMGFAPVPAFELNAPALPSDGSSEVPTLQAVCPTWSYAIAEQAALVLFSEAPQSTTIPVQSYPRRVHICDPVALKTVSASSLAWKPMRDPETGRTGVIFLLGSEQGAVDFKGAARSAPRGGSELAETRVEVNVDGHGELERVAVVQSDYFPLAVAAGVADASSLLVYEQPEAHLQSLRALRDELRSGSDPELGYVPTAELCVTPGFDRLLLKNNSRASGEDNDAARRAWWATKQFLKTLSGLTADCIDAYTLAELTRTHAHELSHEYQRWRGSVV